MAKIENTQAYPTVTPAMDDLLIATDVSDNNETVTFLVSDLIGGAGVLQGLQSVLDTGNTAIQNINLTGNITVVGTVYPTTITAGGSTGVAGQILQSTGTGIQWVNSPSVSCCGWEDTLIIDSDSSVNATMSGATMTFQNAGGAAIITSPATLQSSGINTFTGEVQINGTQINFNASGQINDSAGSTGTPGQWLTATLTGVEWSSTVPATSCCNIQDTLGAGSTALNQGVSFTGISSVTFAAGVSIGSAGNNVWSGTNTFSGTLDVDACLEDSLGSCGTAGQVLISTGTAVQWSNGAGIGAQDLQGVLDTGNTASGANASITITGTLDAGTITDNTGSTGAVGQVLSMSGAGLTWITPAAGTVTSVTLNPASPIGVSSGPPLSISPTTGAVVVTPFVFGGSTNIGFVPEYTGGSPTTVFLRGDGTWQVPPGGGGGVTSVTGTLGSSAGSPLTISPTTGAVVIQSNSYQGGVNVGHVPTGGSATTFLRGDGTWVTPSATAGVSDLSVGGVVSSTGLPIEISPASPATGSVTINQTRYTGGTNEGCVPRGSSNDATKYLDGTGNWTVPAGGGSGIEPSYIVDTRFSMSKVSTGTDYWACSGPMNTTWSAATTQFELTHQDPNPPTSGTHWTLEQLNSNAYHKNTLGVCEAAYEYENVCAIHLDAIISGALGAGIVIDYYVYKWNVCLYDTPVLIGALSCEALPAASGATDVYTQCCQIELDPTTGITTLGQNDAIGFWVKYPSGYSLNAIYNLATRLVRITP